MAATPRVPQGVHRLRHALMPPGMSLTFMDPGPCMFIAMPLGIHDDGHDQAVQHKCSGSALCIGMIVLWGMDRSIQHKCSTNGSKRPLLALWYVMSAYEEKQHPLQRNNTPKTTSEPPSREYPMRRFINMDGPHGPIHQVLLLSYFPSLLYCYNHEWRSARGPSYGLSGLSPWGTTASPMGPWVVLEVVLRLVIKLIEVSTRKAFGGCSMRTEFVPGRLGIFLLSESAKVVKKGTRKDD